MELVSEADMLITSNPIMGGALRLNTGSNLYLAGDLNVAGIITGDIITAESRLGTGPFGGVTAGLAGFTSGTGGLSLGIPDPLTPVAVPGSIFTAGPINSAIAVNAPLGNFLIMDAVLMTDIINTSIFDAHIHYVFAPGAPTSIPIPAMF